MVILASQIWSGMWHMGIPVGEKVARTVLVYVGLVVLLRVAGKRDLAQLNSLDLVVLLLLSNVVQNAVIGPDDSVTGGLIGAVVLIAANNALVRSSFRSGGLTNALEGDPTELVRDGEVQKRELDKLGLRRHDVLAALRRQGATRLSDVQQATLEPNGTLTMQLKEHAGAATSGQLARLEHKVDQLLDQLGNGGTFGS